MGPVDASGNAVEKEFSGWHRDGGIGATRFIGLTEFLASDDLSQ